jgi:hypothetical protein
MQLVSDAPDGDIWARLWLTLQNQTEASTEALGLLFERHVIAESKHANSKFIRRSHTATKEKLQ